MSSATPNIVLTHFLEKWSEPNCLVEKPVLDSTITENKPHNGINKGWFHIRSQPFIFIVTLPANPTTQAYLQQGLHKYKEISPLSPLSPLQLSEVLHLHNLQMQLSLLLCICLQTCPHHQAYQKQYNC